MNNLSSHFLIVTIPNLSLMMYICRYINAYMYVFFNTYSTFQHMKEFVLFISCRCIRLLHKYFVFQVYEWVGVTFMDGSWFKPRNIRTKILNIYSRQFSREFVFRHPGCFCPLWKAGCGRLIGDHMWKLTKTGLWKKATKWGRHSPQTASKKTVLVNLRLKAQDQGGAGWQSCSKIELRSIKSNVQDRKDNLCDTSE
jgi:hypothetical protein